MGDMGQLNAAPVCSFSFVVKLWTFKIHCYGSCF